MDSSALFLKLLHHSNLHAALDFLQHGFIHEVANEKDATAARLEDVLGREGIGDLFGDKAFALVLDANHQFVGAGGRHRAEVDDHFLGLVVLVAMLDGVDDRFTHGDADPVQFVFVEAGHLADMIGDDLHEVEHVEGGIKLNTNRARWDHLAGALSARSMCRLSTIALHIGSTCYS